MARISLREARGRSREKSKSQQVDKSTGGQGVEDGQSQQPQGLGLDGGRREKSTPGSQQVDKSKAKLEPASLQASKPSSLDAAAVDDLIEWVRGIEHVLGTACPLVEQARQIAFTMVCDDPAKRDALARLGHRLTGGDIDRFGPHNLRLMDDDLLEGVIQAADSVIDAALWRLDRLRCVLVRCAETSKSRKVEKSTVKA